MPQAKISAFFKPSSPHPPPVAPPPPPLEVPVTYTRRHRNPETKRRNSQLWTLSSDIDGGQLGNSEIEENDGIAVSSLRSDPVGKLVNKKRSYAQYHLELGQSNFLLHTCSVCGLRYARGDEGDEKVHKNFHKSYYEGIQFKGWRSERVVSKPGCNGDRILLVLDCDPPAQKRKVQEIIKIMEKELGFGDDRLLHKLCKVFLFISRNRIAGCLVAEPIKKAHRVISSSSSCKDSDDISHELAVADTELMRPKPTIQFGAFSFKREVIKRSFSTNGANVDQWYGGAILCEEQAVLALCGFRAIWVVPSHRRKGIASQLLDVARKMTDNMYGLICYFSCRKSFCNDKMSDHSQCAFSPPTSAGKALASRFSSSNSFLVYMAEDDV
ncbi:protein CHROMOSOME TRANSMISSION FIDELITY 7 [Cocos nucifera]|uniref:Protein CHROMOSOME TRANSMISSION FIDELITY 7 n=1 Tax=Cocos nucifera TaxID=13894 RepID=A0A8K0IWG2_COCNU|nr:protein CHROMOSOME TRANSMISSION FIDELITY 7 [Cocos nucifera]